MSSQLCFSFLQLLHHGVEAFCLRKLALVIGGLVAADNSELGQRIADQLLVVWDADQVLPDVLCLVTSCCSEHSSEGIDVLAARVELPGRVSRSIRLSMVLSDTREHNGGQSPQP